VPGLFSVGRATLDRLTASTLNLERLAPNVATQLHQQNSAIENILQKMKPEKPDSFDNLLTTLTSSILRIGAVLIGIFLIQILVSFSRYYFKLAKHLSMAAALISLSGVNQYILRPPLPYCYRRESISAKLRVLP
jgi:hypothetical protein